MRHNSEKGGHSIYAHSTYVYANYYEQNHNMQWHHAQYTECRLRLIAVHELHDPCESVLRDAAFQRDAFQSLQSRFIRGAGRPRRTWAEQVWKFK